MGLLNSVFRIRYSAGGSLIVLVVLVVALRSWQIAHTEVSSRDSVGFIRIAWQLEHAPWREVMTTSPQHPGYPLAVLAMSRPVRLFLPDDLPRAWQLSAQLVSILASVLLLVPMFYLGREMFDRRIAFWACVLFQFLPTSGKIMGDALSDTFFLLFACTGLWLASRALRKRSLWLFALTGFSGALAYWTRPEGALVVAAAGLVLVGVQWSRSWRQTWRNMLLQGSALSLPALVVMAPYMLLIGGLTVKNTPNLMINQQRPDADWENRLRPQPPPNAEPQTRATQPSSVLLAAFFGPGDRTFDRLANEITNLHDLANHRPASRYLWALKAFVFETGKGFFYVVWLPVVLGLWWRRDRFLVVPGVWVTLLVCLPLAVLLFLMAEKMGYLSDRHLLLIILCGTYWAVAGTFLLGEKLALGAARLWPTLAGRGWTDGRTWSFALLLLFVLAPLPRTLARLHAERSGFRSLGHWLAKNTMPGDYIEDPYCWAYYYAGRVFVEGRPDLPVHKPSCFYVVLEKSKNRHTRLVSLQKAVEKILAQKEAKVVHALDVRRGHEKATLQVWQVPGAYQWSPMPGLLGQRN
ncbi:MAG TPA: glycosyltransferase family 39 protein [Gemmataceae bacterium]|nr:glycosyltransferase family 39 protein [Gemmataceae bacterium]